MAPETDRREKREERREKIEERREKRDDRLQTRRGCQRFPNEAAEGPKQRGRPVSTPYCPSGGLISGPKAEGREQRKREKRAERREKMAASSIHCILAGSRGHFKEVMKIKGSHRKWPPVRLPAFLQGPVATSMRAQKTTTNFRWSLSQKL